MPKHHKIEISHDADLTAQDVGGAVFLRAVRWLTLGAAALMFTITQVRFSLDRGCLSRPPIGDDIAYINDGIRRLDAVYLHGWIRLFPEYVRQPPHSPISTAIAFFGMMLFGIRQWAPYALNVVLVFALLWSVDFLMRGAKPWHRVAACVYALTIPFAANVVSEFRPDMAWGLAAAMAVILPIRRSLVAAPKRYAVACGAWCAFALLAKPATSPLTIITVGMAWLLAAMCDYLDSDRTISILRLAVALAPCVAAAVIIAGPHYLLDYRGIYQYIVGNSFGPHKDLWRPAGGLGFQALYFFSGDGGRFMLGVQVWTLAAIVVIGSFTIIYNRSADPNRLRRGLCMVAIAVGSYAFVTINPTKNAYLGAEAQALLILGSVVVLRMFATAAATRRGRRLADIAMAAVLSAGLMGWGFPNRWKKPGSESVAESNETALSVAACVYNNIPFNGTVFVTGYGCVNSGSIAFLSRQRGKSILGCDFHRENDLQLYRNALDQADVVVAAQSGVAEYRPELPSYEVLDQTLAMTRTRPDLRQVGAVRSKTGKSFFVFARAATFGGWDGVVGLAPVDDGGQISERRFRWGLESGVIVRVSTAVAGIRQLLVDARSPVEGQEVIFTLDGKDIDRHIFAAKNIFESLRLPLKLSPGDHEIELRFKKSLPMSRKDGRLKAVQFEKLWLASAGESIR